MREGDKTQRNHNAVAAHGFEPRPPAYETGLSPRLTAGTKIYRFEIACFPESIALNWTWLSVGFDTMMQT